MISKNTRPRIFVQSALIVFMAFCLFFITQTHASEIIDITEDSAKEQEEEVAVDDNDTAQIVVVELFSSQACTFCPAADTIMGDLIQQSHVIGLTCHVNYFDVKRGSLAKPFCTKRQSDYTNLIGSGPYYTPQMVINGHMDVVGYEVDNIAKALENGQSDMIQTINIQTKADGVFVYNLGEQDLSDQQVRLWISSLDKPHNVTIAEGGNRGQRVVYHNMMNDVKDLGAWNGSALERAISPELSEDHKGFVIIAQNIESGKIVAAGQYIQ